MPSTGNARAPLPESGSLPHDGRRRALPMRARPALLVLALLGLLLLASPARAEARAPPDLSFLLLPSAPGASDLSLVTPPSDRPSRGAPWPALVGVGVGASAVWASHSPLVQPVQSPTRAEGAALFAITGVSALAVLIGSALPGRVLPSRDLRALLVIGP